MSPEVRESTLRHLDTKAAIASAALEGSAVPNEVKALMEQYAGGRITADQMLREVLRINDRILGR